MNSFEGKNSLFSNSIEINKVPILLADRSVIKLLALQYQHHVIASSSLIVQEYNCF